MEKIAPGTLDFLKALKKNNNKDWFDRHKEKYLAAKDDVSAFLDELLPGLCKIDRYLAGLTSKDCMFRIYRDVRFSSDKRPYKTNMGASINAGGKKAMNAGFYIHFEPGASFFAGGMWQPPSDQLKMIRQEIDYNGKDLKKILNSQTFKKYYGGLAEEYRLKSVPRGYPKDHPDIELLKYNSYIVWRAYSDKEILSPGFGKEILKAAKIMQPFLAFLNTAIHV